MLELFKIHDVRTHDDWLGSCGGIVHFLKNAHVFKKGMNVLWIEGERQCQRHPGRFFDYDEMEDLFESEVLSKEDIDLIGNTSIVYLDNNWDVDKITNEKKGYIKVTPVKLEAECPSNMDLLEEFIKNIKPKKIDDNFSGNIYGLDPFEELHERIIQSSQKLNIPLKVEESTIEHMNVPYFKYIVNGHLVAYYHDTPHLDEKGTWNIRGNAQNLRRLARSLSTTV